jgi:hypothetical protein
MADTFKKWQEFISKPDLDLRLASLVVFAESFVVISGKSSTGLEIRPKLMPSLGTFYGTEEEFVALGFEAYFTEGVVTHKRRVGTSTNWVEHIKGYTEKTLGELGHTADRAFLKLTGGIVRLGILVLAQTYQIWFTSSQRRST